MRFLLALLALTMLSASANPFLVAHRGASGKAPENTLPAFELAWKENADAIEGDFHLTKDGKIVCIHDSDTERIAGKKLVIKESTLTELQALDAGAWKDDAFAGTRIPTITQVLSTVPPGKKIYLEVKCGPEIVPGLLAEIEQSKLQDEQIVVISFHAEVIEEVRKRRPQWVANFLYSFDKRLPDAPARELPKVLEVLTKINASGIGTNAHPSLEGKHLARFRAAGFPHHVWTVDDEKTARRFLGMGSKSVTTNYPGALRASLQK